MTALSNLEVDNLELAGRTLLDVPGYDRKVEFGIIVHFKYPIENSDETIEVATTRPETMLGDSGIAVHPDDPRYTHLVGKFAVHPFIKGRRLPIVADTYVDREFGTGAVKLTPAHDPNDFNLGQTHNLEFINILTDDGLINENGGPYQGQKRFDVRYSIQDDLKKLGLYVDKKDNPMTVPLSERTRDIVEPLMKPQWWVKMSELAGPAIKAVQTGEIKIRPESAEKSYLNWMAGINDWCISRQLWWGHQCPVYQVRFEGEDPNQPESNDRWFAGRTEEEGKAATTCEPFVWYSALTRTQPSPRPRRRSLTRSSSWLVFPCSPKPGQPQVTFLAHHWLTRSRFATRMSLTRGSARVSGLSQLLAGPTRPQISLACTRPAFLRQVGISCKCFRVRVDVTKLVLTWICSPFWVARMIFLGIKLTGKVPFSEVFCHSLSKSYM